MKSRLLEICRYLNLEIVTPFNLELPNGEIVSANALIKDVGGENGMLLFNSGRDFGPARENRRNVEVMGYGWTCYGSSLDDTLDLIPDNEEALCEERLNDYIEMFSEWGWGNARKVRPMWMLD